MSTLERLSDYARNPATRCTDRRWEAILADIRAGRITVQRGEGRSAWIALVG